MKNLDKIAWWIIAILLVLLPFHAFLFTWFKSFFWTDSWTIAVQSWKEILVVALGGLALAKIFVERRLPRSKSFWIAGVIILLAVVYFFLGHDELTQKIFGFRTAVFFLAAFAATQFFDFEKSAINHLEKIEVVVGGLVIAFAFAQKFLLPNDFLSHFGYSTVVSTWLPGGNLPMYHVVGETGVIRLQSTLAGPNQLAAYLLVVQPIAFFVAMKNRGAWRWIAGAVALAAAFEIFWTYSRAAWLGEIAILFLIFLRTNRQLFTKKVFFGGLAALAIFSIFAAANPTLRDTITRQASTSEHFQKSLAAAEKLLQKPLGLGLGSTAGVSQRFDENHSGLTPENEYLRFGIELGWLGGLLFLAFVVTLFCELSRKKSALAISLAGVAVMMFFLHPLEDASVSLTLFLLAGAEVKN